MLLTSILSFNLSTIEYKFFLQYSNGSSVAIKQHPKYLNACVVRNFLGITLLYSISNLSSSKISS